MRDLRTYVLEGFKLGKNKVKKEEDFVDLGLPSRTLWCKYNVGATCASTAKSWYGDYFMWGDTEPATDKKCNWENYKYANGAYNKLTKYCPVYKINYWGGKGKPDNKLVLDEEDDMARANMGDDWKMPTREQLQELIKNTTSKSVKKYNNIRGLNGLVLTSKINNNTLFIPATGYRDGSSLFYVGSRIDIWTSSLTEDAPYNACNMYSDNRYIHTYDFNRHYGFSVRGVMV